MSSYSELGIYVPKARVASICCSFAAALLQVDLLLGFDQVSPNTFQLAAAPQQILKTLQNFFRGARNRLKASPNLSQSLIKQLNQH